MSRFRARLLQVVGVLVPLILLDQATKRWAVETLRNRPVERFLGDTFRLGYAENTGVFLGWGDRFPPGIRFALFVGLVGIALVAALVYVLRTEALRRPQVIALAAILAGGLSNLGDRVGHDGVVIDFMNLGIGRLRTGVFNVADMAVTGGVLVLLFLGMVQGGKDDRGEEAGESPPDGSEASRD